MPSTPAQVFAEIRPVVVIIDTPTLIAKSQSTLITASGPTVAQPCPAVGPALLLSQSVAGGSFAVGNPADTFAVSLVHVVANVGIPALSPAGGGGCGAPFLVTAPGVYYNLSGVAFNTDGEPLSWAYQQNWIQVIGEPTVAIPSTASGPSHGGLGEAAPGAWPEIALNVSPVGAHSYQFQVDLFAWWSTEGDPEIPPPPPPDVEFTPPPIPNCAGSFVTVGGQGVGVVPD